MNDSYGFLKRPLPVVDLEIGSPITSGGFQRVNYATVAINMLYTL